MSTDKIRALLHRWFHTSRRVGPFYVSVWDWEDQHELCCRGRHLRAHHATPQAGKQEQP